MSSIPQTGHSHSSPFPQMMALNASGGIITENSLNKMTPVAMCRHGQELVQDITQKMLDILGILKSMQLPPVVERGQGPDKKARLEDLLHRSEATFQKLRFIYDSTSNIARHVGHNFLESILIPEELSMDDPQSTELMRSDEEKKLIEQIRLKNQIIKETIEVMRKTISKTDSMLSCRKML